MALKKISKISLLESSFWFFIPGFIMYIGFYIFMPAMKELGISYLFSFLLFLWGSTILLIPLSIFLYKKEGNKLEWGSFKERFRIKKLTKKEWLLVFGVLALVILSDGIFSETAKWLGTLPGFSPPEYFTAPFNPFDEILPFTHLFDFELKGQWWLLAVWIPLHTLSMIGEELMWRGYILPRQEATHKRPLIIHVCQWAFLVHAFMKWNFIGMLPGMFLTTWIAYKTKNTLASFLVHALGNSLLWILLLLGIMGIW